MQIELENSKANYTYRDLLYDINIRRNVIYNRGEFMSQEIHPFTVSFLEMKRKSRFKLNKKRTKKDALSKTKT